MRSALRVVLRPKASCHRSRHDRHDRHAWAVLGCLAWPFPGVFPAQGKRSAAEAGLPTKAASRHPASLLLLAVVANKKHFANKNIKKQRFSQGWSRTLKLEGPAEEEAFGRSRRSGTWTESLSPGPCVESECPFQTANSAKTALILMAPGPGGPNKRTHSHQAELVLDPAFVCPSPSMWG